MEFVTLLIIAIGLSFDTFAVSVTTGLIISHIKFWQAVRVAIILAVFQAIMPVIGWFFGKQIARFIIDYNHWVAFGLLSVLGMKMMYESFKKDKDSQPFNPLKTTVVIGMAIATSIDALVVGVSFAFIEMNIYWSAFVIGFVTFLVAMLGMFFGKKVGGRLGKRMEIVGGVILIAIGVKILLEHLL